MHINQVVPKQIQEVQKFLCVDASASDAENLCM